MVPERHSDVKFANANGIEIAFETVGDPGGRPLLLVCGLGGQLVDWDLAFCQQLAAAGHWLIRFDNRDMGLSTHLTELGKPNLRMLLAEIAQGHEVEAPYLLSDMAADAIGLLDALEISSSHVLGVSMGGMIAQTMAIHFPERVSSLTSIMSSADPSQPAPTPEALQMLFTPAPASRKGYLDYQVEVMRVLGSPGFPLDEPKVRYHAGLAYDRGLNPAGFARQLVAVWASGDRKAALRKLNMPVLVIHGEADPLVPAAGGIETAECISGAELMLIEGMGHDLPAGVWPQLVETIARHTAGA